MSAASFPRSEYETRVRAAQSRMEKSGVDALLITTEADFRYFSGFLTRFWESPTRPWFLVVPRKGAPVAVIPTIGEALMRSTWVVDIRCWRSPDATDDGVSLLSETLRDLAPENGTIAWPSGGGSHLRMPLEDWQRVQEKLPKHLFVPDGGLVKNLRMVKSEAEIERITKCCAIANRAFFRMHEIAGAGATLSEVFRKFQGLCLEEGADWVPYLAGGAGPGGYADVISPASDRALVGGDVMMLDTGLMLQGYFCDFDRNFSIGPASPEVQSAHARLIEATQAGFEHARPGTTAAELFAVMNAITSGDPKAPSDAGRLGHGLGMQLTEPPSLIADENTVLQPGMVLTLEPGIETGDGLIMVHEENIVIREHGAEWLSEPSSAQIMELS